MKLFAVLKTLTAAERRLWLGSVLAILTSAVLSGAADPLSLTASLIGVTALIFVAKGAVLGQLLTVVFAVFYGVISLQQRYYGEMITYLGMTAPMAVLAVISWVRHPYRDSGEVRVSRITPPQMALVWLLAAVTTAVFYFILRALGNASLGFSTLSVTTSFLASALTFLRSPYYALGYAANDLVLIVLWTVAAAQQPSCFAMVVCFAAFLVNDLYGFYNWRRMQRRQQAA